MYLPTDTDILYSQRDNVLRKADCSRQRRDEAAAWAIDGRIAVFENLSSPADIALTFGPNAGHDALILQQQSLPARSAILTGTTDTVASGAAPTFQDIISSAPKNISLNGQPSQVNGCAWNVPRPVHVDYKPIPTMPLRAPVVVQTPIGPATFPPPQAPGIPQWINLCWAVRNGAVDASQFTPDELMALQYKCTQLGYTGACPPPPNTLEYLRQRRANKTLPHIQVTDDLLNSLPQAPTQIGACPDSYKQAGLTGLGGYEPTWADALVMAESGQAVSDAGVVGWVQAHPWLSLALAAGGVVALSKRRGR